MDELRVKLKDVEVADLNNVCIMIISKFARVLREHNGTVIELRDKHVVREVAKHAAMARNPQLEALYMRLKVEIKNHLNKPSIRNGGFDNIVGKTKLREQIYARRLARERNSEKSEDR